MFTIILMWTYTHSGSQRITSGVLARLLVQRTVNKQLFGIRLHWPRSRMPCLHLRKDVDALLYWLWGVEVPGDWKFQIVLDLFRNSLQRKSAICL